MRRKMRYIKRMKIIIKIECIGIIRNISNTRREINRKLFNDKLRMNKQEIRTE